MTYQRERDKSIHPNTVRNVTRRRAGGDGGAWLSLERAGSVWPSSVATVEEQRREGLVKRALGRVAAGMVTSFDSEQQVREEAKRWMADLDLKGKPVENAVVDAMAVRDPDADPITDEQGHPEPDADLRDNENVPLPSDPVRYEPVPTERLAMKRYQQAVEQYVEQYDDQEVHPYVPDAWPDHTKTKIATRSP